MARTADGKKLLSSKKIDITVSLHGKHEVVLKAVPKQMLAHFCGWDDIAPLLWCCGGGRVQELRLKRKYCKYKGLKIVVDWMQRACKNPELDPLKAPKTDITVACCIQRALRALGCFTDAARVNRFIKCHYFERPLNGKKVADLTREFDMNRLHMHWMAANVHTTLSDGWSAHVLPSSFKRNLRAVIQTCPSLDSPTGAGLSRRSKE
jgi:hypothetical protein